MDLSLLMIILGSHKFIFLHIRMKHCIHSLDIARKFKTKKGLTLINVRSDHVGEFENHSFLNRFVMNMVMAIIFLLLELPNKMRL